MRHSRPKTLFLPVLGLLSAVLVLLTVVTITTYFNLSKTRRQARHALTAQGAAVINGLAAGLRTGLRHLVWQTDYLQGLVADMAQSGDVAFIALLSPQGRILAHSDSDKAGRPYRNFIKLKARLNRGTFQGWFQGKNLYLTAQWLQPEDLKPPIRRRMFKEHPIRRRVNPPDFTHQSAVIVVGLKTRAYQQDQSRQLQHALLMGGLLFVLGSAAIYFIFIVQNYRTIDHTLTNLSTYTASIVDNMPNGLITLDAQGRPVMINRAARDMFGWGDRPEQDLVEEKVITELAGALDRLLVGEEKILDLEFEFSTAAEGGFPLAVSAAKVPAGSDGQDGAGTVVILIDLRQIRALEDQVRQAEKMAAIGRLAAGVAHEVRNPLSSMRGLARFLARGLDAKSRESEYLGVMVQEIDRLNRVITGLLDYARPNHPELTAVDLNKTVRHTIDLVADDARHRKITLRKDLARERLLIRADRDQAVQALLNLLLNAIESMPDGGRLTVSTDKGETEATLTVEDTGSGLPVENRYRLLDPFYTTKKKGSGLGLAQVAKIMESHNGRLHLGGTAGIGARVVLFFPLAGENEEGAPSL